MKNKLRVIPIMLCVLFFNPVDIKCTLKGFDNTKSQVTVTAKKSRGIFKNFPFPLLWTGSKGEVKNTKQVFRDAPSKIQSSNSIVHGFFMMNWFTSF
jgi:hypothetical protein